nr:MFS transporter [Pseudomonas syringae]
MVGLVMAGLVVNYLARNTLSVAAPTLMTELSISTEQYSHIVVAWQICYAVMQPVAGYIIDAIGTKMGFAIFAVAWSAACAVAAFATGWQSLAIFRGMLGFLGAAAFTMVFGVLVTKIGYSPLFVVLAVFDIIAAVVVWNVARELPEQPLAVNTVHPEGNPLPI